MERRHFLRLMTLAGVMGPMGWMDRVPVVRGLSAGLIVDRQLVTEMETLAQGLWHNWHLADPRELNDVLTGFAALLAQLEDRATPLYHDDLLRVMALVAAMSGLVLRVLGRDDAAYASLMGSRIYSGTAGDDHLEALALLWASDIMSSVQLGGVGPSPSIVRDDLDEACRLSAGGATALRSYVAFRRAEEFAAMGERVTSLRVLDHAMELCGAPDGLGLWGRPWPVRVDTAFSGNVLLLAGLPRHAAATLERALEHQPAGEVTSDGIAVLADLGAARVRSGDLDEGCRVLSLAWNQAKLTGMVDRQHRVTGIVDRELTAHGTEPRVRTLRELMAASAG